MENAPIFANPFKPGAGHQPPYLAGRKTEEMEFRKLLRQTTILENVVLTGLRGVGKTVLTETFKPIAQQEGWLWVGTDLSETASISEAKLAERLITDLSVVTRGISVGTHIQNSIGYNAETTTSNVVLGYDQLQAIYSSTPGLVADKLKAVFNFVAPHVSRIDKRGILFTYDEAQNLSDHAAKEQYPLSLLLELFQSIQRQGIPFMLMLVGLPTLFPKLVEARTYAERMFRVLFLKQLNEAESKDAIQKPIQDANCPVSFNMASINLIAQHAGGYPYFIQFLCREAYDAWIQKNADGKPPSVPITEITRKLDNDFFAGRWARVTDRQQELLHVIATLDTSNDEFTVQEILAKSKEMSSKPFGRSHVNQLLIALTHAGLIYKNRHGKYLFAVPLMADFIRRMMKQN
jgi:hypothetical protein